MEQLVRFEESREKVAETRHLDVHLPDGNILSLRSRLINADFHDSVEVRISLLSELLFQIYRHLLALQKETNETHQTKDPHIPQQR